MRNGKYFPIDFTIENGFCEDFPGTKRIYIGYSSDNYVLRDLPSQEPRLLKQFINRSLEAHNIGNMYSAETIKRIKNGIL